ncbi:MAG: hypothetical protein JW849_10755 [Phycisphaerae bacterium]|nr:hypothetical protein [Phycisphaerae bacterium]
MKRVPFFILLAVLFTAAPFWACPARAQGKLPDDLLLPADGRRMQGMFRLSDEKGGTWGIHLQCGFIQESTGNVYGSGMYLHLQGNNFYAQSNQGLLNKAGNEVQIGPWNQMDLVVYRRIKIFKKEGLARWLEIIHNPGAAKRVSVLLRTHMNYGIQSLTTSSGKGSFTDKDFAFVTTCPNPTAAATLHVVCGPMSKLRPRVLQQGNRYDVTYDLSLPAGGTVVLAGFEAQRPSAAKLQPMMKKFRPRRYLRDLPMAVRRLIANVRASGGPDDMELDREEHADRVILRDGQEFLGTIAKQPAFRVATARGELTLPAERVVGMIAWGAEPGRLRTLLTDGQIVTGTLGEQTIPIDIATVGRQVIPLRDVRAWSYRISKRRPDETPFDGPYLRLRTGDRLAFAADSVPFRLQTRNGVVDLDPAAMLSIQLDNAKHNLHRAVFRNGSELSGLLLPEAVEPKLQLGGKQTIPRDLLTCVEYAQEEDADSQDLPKLVLADGDVLRGQFDQAKLTLKGKYGQMTLQPGNIRTLQPIPDRTSWFRATLWNGSTVQGLLETPRLRFRVQPGPAVEISPARIASFDQPNVLPPTNVIHNVAELVVQLGSESYKDRKAAQEKLIQMGPGIVPILKKHLDDKDPEIRQRVRDILDELTAVG